MNPKPKIHNILFTILFVSITCLFIWMISDFIIPIIWALALSILFYPICNKLTQKIHYRAIAASLTLILIIMIILIPMMTIGSLLVTQSADMYSRVSGSNTYIATIKSAPILNNALSIASISAEDIYVSFTQITQVVGNWLASQLLVAGSKTIGFIMSLFVMLYVLFFFIKDGSAIWAKTCELLPIGNDRLRFLADKFIIATQAIIKGSIIVAIAQGFIGFLLFSIVGIENPILWASVLAITTFIPGIGAATTWLPIAIYLIIANRMGDAILLTLGGVLIIGTVDNILRPILVGRNTDIPDALVFLSILGGISAFGVSGILIGPMIAALFVSTLELFEKDVY